MKYFPTKARESIARSRSRKQPDIFRIEGENVGFAEIAKRLCVAVQTAQKRMARLRGASGAITWDRLGRAE